jgi:pyrroline-5-carboxylate reductase
MEGQSMSLELIQRFLGGSTIGLFGAGHLGRAIAEGLLEAGLPSHHLAICHRGSEKTHRELAASGLTGLVATTENVTRQSKILLYLVRPQDYLVIRDFDLREDSLFISFLAGVPLKNLPVRAAEVHSVRVMTSAPDTLRRRNGIAALYPADNPLTREILESLGLRVVLLREESDIHAFTALGPCLPIALTCWEGLGNQINDSELLETARIYSMPDYQSILQWAHSVRPRLLSAEERKRYLVQATTPGGVTDAILSAMRNGMRLSAALEQGIERSQGFAGA